MNKKQSRSDGTGDGATEPDPHGHAALLLVESLIHGLIASSSLTVAQAVEIVQIAAEVKQATADDVGDTPATLHESLHLLNSISASLIHDLPSADGAASSHPQGVDGNIAVANSTNVRLRKYFFHVRTGDEVTEDFEGSHHPDHSAARQEAIDSAIELVCMTLKAGKGLQLQRSIIINTEDGTEVGEVPFGDAVRARKR